MTVGTTMQAPIRVDAHALERMVRILPMIGSMAALASWNSRMQPAKINSLRSHNTLRRLAVGAPSLVCLGRSISLIRMRVSAKIAGAARMAVRKNTA